MLVGVQPGEQEERHGKPALGPAGGTPRQALDEAAIAPRGAFITDAAKHFKFVMCGKRRRQKRRPNARAIEQCHRWPTSGAGIKPETE